MLSKQVVGSGVMALLLLSCSPARETQEAQVESPAEEFVYSADRFADIEVVRYQVPGFDELTLQQKKFLYYLTMAGMSGRDIIWDQNNKHNLRIRRTLEAIVRHYEGDRTTPEWDQFMTYVKRVWFANGIHHHYGRDKFEPGFSAETFTQLVQESPDGQFPLLDDETVDDLVAFLTPVLFDPQVDAKQVNLSAGEDLVATSATNYYEDVTQQEVEEFYRRRIDPADPRPVQWGLNSKLIKEGGEIREKVWRIGGMYSEAIEQIVGWLEKAATVAETESQRAVIEKLIEFYRTGDLETFDEFSVAWAQETEARVDFINGFIEVYGDPLAYRGAFEAFAFFKDLEATERIEAIGAQAQWFEDHSTIREEHKKKDVTGIAAKVITVASAAGDAYPSIPIGINLPNPNWIRREFGSKSVSLGNVVEAFDESARGSGFLEEFAHDEEEIARAREYGDLSDKLHTDMHEVIGHASGQIEPGVGTPKETLKNYRSTVEEARADLVALYFMMDPKLVEIGVMDSLEVGKEEYDGYIRNGLMTQLARLELGEVVEQAHMRNRKMVSQWAFDNGRGENVIEKVFRDGKTYFEIHDYERLRTLFGELLREMQRIVSQGDFEAAQQLVETYGVTVDPELHAEVLERYATLDRKPYRGILNPKLTPVEDAGGEIVDIEISYPSDYTQHMLELSRDFSFLPHVN